MSRLKLNDSHKTELRKYAREAWAAKTEAITMGGFWDAVDECSPFENDDVELVVALIFHDSGSHESEVQFLAGSRSKVESLVHAQMDAGRKTWTADQTIQLLRSVGTSKSIPYLRNLDVGSRSQEAKDDAIRFLESRSRQ